MLLKYSSCLVNTNLAVKVDHVDGIHHLKKLRLLYELVSAMYSSIMTENRQDCLLVWYGYGPKQMKRISKNFPL